jgi:ubiquinone/menaquinone biosynthesis C-methylase UbiE
VAQLGLANIEFRRADLESLPFPDETFDAVLCVFGIFFVSDLHGAIRGLWRLVRPGGTLAVTILGPELRLSLAGHSPRSFPLSVQMEPEPREPTKSPCRSRFVPRCLILLGHS